MFGWFDKKETQRMSNAKTKSGVSGSTFKTSIDSKLSEFAPSGNQTPTLEPNGSGGGYIDVINGYRWTATELGPAALAEIPLIYMREFRSTRSGADLVQQGIVASQIGGIKARDPYDGLYSFDDPTGFIYVFPFFTNTYYDLNNTFKSTDPLEAVKAMAAGGAQVAKAVGGLSKAKSGALRAIGAVAKGVGTAIEYGSAASGAAEAAATIRNKLKGFSGGVGKLDEPMIWSDTSPRTTSFTVYLLNTYSLEDIKKNWELTYILRYQNTMNKLTLIQALPPCFYEVMIPGQHYARGAFMSNLKIDSVGSTRLFKASEIGLSMANTVHIPDAWAITISLTDFIKPSQNMLHNMHEDNLVKVGASGSTAAKMEVEAKGVSESAGAIDKDAAIE